jgi:phospholipase C
MKRRDLLKSMGAVAGAAGLSKFLPGCGGDDGGGPGEIKNVVLLMMENRSYDHWLGARSLLEGKPGDGLLATMSNRDRDGNDIAVWPASGSLCVPDPPHSWGSSHDQWAGGMNAGFLTEHQRVAPGDLSALQYMTRQELPVTWALADAYATCDRWFASVMGPTWPNRMYWLAGTSMGMQGNELPPEDFTAPTIFHRLDEKAVPWKLYYGDLPFLFLLGHGFDVDPVGRVLPIDDFYSDAAAGTLPPVTYLDPPFGYADDHPPHHPILGQQFLASVYTALASSPQWKDTLLVVTYDEHGGFFDHVPPPTVADDRAAMGFDQLGFRVPSLVIGPYVKQGFVSSVQRDHTSALKHLETMFGLAPLTVRSSAASDLADLIDTDRLAAGDAAAPITLAPVDVEEAMMDAQCLAAETSAHDVLRFADRHPELVAGWDRRRLLPETARRIAAELERHGGGRLIRR